MSLFKREVCLTEAIFLISITSKVTSFNSSLAWNGFAFWNELKKFDRKENKDNASHEKAVQPSREGCPRVAVEILVKILTTSRNKNGVGEEDRGGRLTDGGEEQKSAVDEGRGRDDQEGQKSLKIWWRYTFVYPDTMMILAHNVTLTHLAVPVMK